MQSLRGCQCLSSFDTTVSGSSSIRTKATLASRFTSTQLGSSVAKIWLYPDVRVASSSGFSAKEQALLMEAVEQNRELIERRWNEHFG